MLTLGLETSGAIGGVALVRDGEMLLERSLSHTGRKHARTLVAEIQTLFRDASINVQDLGLVCVSIGPGSFTGLRVGVVSAKTLAYALKCPVVAVDTFLTVTAQLASQLREVWVIDDAQRGDLFAGHYQRTGSGWTDWKRRGDVRVISLADFLLEVPPEAMVVGPGVDKFAQEFASQKLHTERLLPPAGALTLWGERLYHAGETCDPVMLEPLYLRRSAAEDQAEARRQQVPS